MAIWTMVKSASEGFRMYSVAVVLVVIHGVALQTSEAHEPSLAPSELTTMNTTGSSSVIKLFVRTWPGYCSVHACRKLQAKDSIPMWTIGSLRASIVDDQKAPLSKCKKTEFNVSDIETIRNEISSAWPSFSTLSDKAFWEKHFNRYASCSLNPTKQNYTPLEYFTTAIKLYQRSNPMKLFEAVGIKENDNETVSLGRLRTAIDVDPSTVEYICEGKHDDTDILGGITLCFSQQLDKRVACPSEPNKTLTCQTERVWYLKTPLRSLASTGVTDTQNRQISTRPQVNKLRARQADDDVNTEGVTETTEKQQTKQSGPNSSAINRMNMLWVLIATSWILFAHNNVV
ncbi:uncharacterized protein LOC111263099 [Varroa jacobsoni]|uniref:uncharacterized protein LOC111263099 n=1 Tax=Varroa jacobsoni TaxID=62625 RepID=UPI000BFA9447|nr:uncharacterized protein LOC111263099 [Varroa jacobsoni]